MNVLHTLARLDKIPHPPGRKIVIVDKLKRFEFWVECAFHEVKTVELTPTKIILTIL